MLLRIILNIIKKRVEEVLAEKQAGFRAKRSTTEQIFNICLLIEKHLHHQQDVYHNLIDLKNAFDRVWHEGLWQVMRNFNIDTHLIDRIQELYKDGHSAIFINNEFDEFFRTLVGVRQGCFLSPVLFNVFLEHIMTETIHGFEPAISIHGRPPICNLRFADDIDLIASSADELQELTTRLDNAARAVGMEISTEKSKVLVNSSGEHPQTQIKLNGYVLQEVESFKYLGSILTSDGSSSQEIKTRIALATSAMAKLSTIWQSKNISCKTKVKLYKSLVLSILLYSCESWTLNAELERRLQSFEFKSYRRILNIKYTEHRTNDYVEEQVTNKAGQQERILTTIRKRKLKWFGHINRHDSLAKTILQGKVRGKRKRGRPRKEWSDNIRDWTGRPLNKLVRLSEDRSEWRKLSGEASMVPLRRTSSRDK